MTLLTEDRFLLDSFRRGDRAALARVHDYYVDQVAAFLRGGFTFSSKGETLAFRRYRSPADLQDMLQETFCKAFSPRARQAYDGIHPFKSYLLTIARNLTIDRFRRQVREVYEPVAGGPDDRLLPDMIRLEVNHRPGLVRVFGVFSRARIDAARIRRALERVRGERPPLDKVRALPLEKGVRQVVVDLRILP